MSQALLDCPACGDPCVNMPPSRPTPEWPDGCWNDGDYGTCECGARVIVDADGENASLQLDEEEETP